MSSKRQRVASIASQDSDENGQNPLGISFGETPTTSPVEVSEKASEIEIADSQEDADDKNEGAELAEGNSISDQVSVSSDIESDKESDKVAPKSTSDIHSRLATRYFLFNTQEMKTIVRWMRMHRTYKITTHKVEFNELAEHLGYTDHSFTPEVQAGLRTKLRTKMVALHSNMRKSGAITDEFDGYESSGSNVYQPLAFAEWTLMWHKKGWDGSLSKPARAKYEAIMNEPDDDGPVPSEGSNKEHGKNSEQQAPLPPPGDAAEPAEGSAPVERSHRDNDYDGVEIFVVEEPSERPEGDEPLPPPEEDALAQEKAWNTYILNKEIIDEHDWNYRVMVAQNLGLNLQDLAVLYPDPFPGYEPCRKEPVAPESVVAEDAPHSSSDTSTLASPASKTTGRKRSRTLSRASSDESIEIGSDDSEDEDELPASKRQRMNSVESEEEIVDEEMEDEEDLDGDTAVEIDTDNGHGSQASNASVGRSTVDTDATVSPEPRTPQRPQSRMAVTPRTPGSGAHTPIYTATWSPQD